MVKGSAPGSEGSGFETQLGSDALAGVHVEPHGQVSNHADGDAWPLPDHLWQVRAADLWIRDPCHCSAWNVMVDDSVDFRSPNSTIGDEFLWRRAVACLGLDGALRGPLVPNGDRTVGRFLP